MPLRVLSSSIETIRLQLRMPFRFGIATVKDLTHVTIRAEMEIDAQRQVGFAADHLVPKWFIKNPDSTCEEDEDHLLRAIDGARRFAEQEGEASCVARLSKRLEKAPPFSPVPLVHQFAGSLIERAAIDALCRAKGSTFAAIVRTNALGTNLIGALPTTNLPERPLRTLIVRHTVGLSDALTDADIGPGERLNDGLPQSLEACVARYGLTHFKIKLAGDAKRDLDRLHAISKVIPDAKAFTLDGNENFRDVEHFGEFWDRFRADMSIEAFRQKLLFVEQPLHRDVTLLDEPAGQVWRLTDRPDLIIDESDVGTQSAQRAYQLGYRGTSYKSCKGVTKGIDVASLMRSRKGLISAEDLSTIGPISLLQDLAVVASLGIEHVERNGHHYFRGLSMFPREVQDQVLASHGDLYEDAGGVVTVRIRGGRIDVGSVVDAPFGYARFR